MLSGVRYMRDCPPLPEGRSRKHAVQKLNGALPGPTLIDRLAIVPHDGERMRQFDSKLLAMAFRMLGQA